MDKSENDCITFSIHKKFNQFLLYTQSFLAFILKFYLVTELKTKLEKLIRQSHLNVYNFQRIY